MFLAAVVAGCTQGSAGDQPRAEYDKTTGHLARIEFDANKNGRNDTVSYMDGTRIIRIELDLDENGKIERWDFYGPDRKLEKVGFASRNDGVMDSQAFYTPEGAVERIEISTTRDATFDRVEFYEQGALVRSQEDTNRDGRPDKWDEYSPHPNHAAGEPAYAISSTAFDDAKTGKPNRRFVYGPTGNVARVEVDREGNGVWRLMSGDSRSARR